MLLALAKQSPCIIYPWLGDIKTAIVFSICLNNVPVCSMTVTLNSDTEGMQHEINLLFSWQKAENIMPRRNTAQLFCLTVVLPEDHQRAEAMKLQFCISQ